MPVKYFQFSSEVQLAQYVAMMNSVKERIDVVANQYHDGQITVTQFKSFLRQHWVPLTEQFISQWSMTLVPVDIHNAIDDVRKNVHLFTVVWPPLRYLRKHTGGDWYLLPLT